MLLSGLALLVPAPLLKAHVTAAPPKTLPTPGFEYNGVLIEKLVMSQFSSVPCRNADGEVLFTRIAISVSGIVSRNFDIETVRKRLAAPRRDLNWRITEDVVVSIPAEQKGSYVYPASVDLTETSAGLLARVKLDGFIGLKAPLTEKH